MLVVIDYGAGNLRSVLHALTYLGVDNLRVARGARDLQAADRIILPGVGAFGAGMQQLHSQGLVNPLKSVLRSGTPYLGICLGMQFLFESSDEMGVHHGLGVLPGQVTRFPKDHPFKVPHMGWNEIKSVRQTPLLANIPAASHAYFVHSYYCMPQNADDVIATADYGITFTAAVQRDNIYGVQFHPEKSQAVGLEILRSFLAI